MPEIGEVARIVGRLRTHLVGRTITSVQAQHDPIVFKDTTEQRFVSELEGQTVQAAKQWGKYFWLVMSKPPHVLMHLGMTGWIHIKDDPLSHYRTKTGEPRWPPRYHKFIFKLQDSTNEIAFVDARRLARIRLIDHANGDLRNVSPLKENGPDPVQEPPTLEWLKTHLAARKVPVKAWLLDQSAIAGIGNWVADEILYQSRLHPESYTHNLQESDVADMHKALLFVTKTAVETDADSSKFPKDWLMLHRWGKGKKGEDANKLPNGDQVEFLKVGGRTSAFVRKLQRKVGPVASEDGAPKRQAKRKRVKQEEEEESGGGAVKEEVEDESEFEVKPMKKGRVKKTVEVRPNPRQTKTEVTEELPDGHEPTEIKSEVEGPHEGHRLRPRRKNLAAQ